MAIGPIARVVVQAAVMGIAILAKAIPRAYGAALNNAKKGGVDATKASEGYLTKKKMNLDEAFFVMNIEKAQVTPELIQKVRNFVHRSCMDLGWSILVQI